MLCPICRNEIRRHDYTLNNVEVGGIVLMVVETECPNCRETYSSKVIGGTELTNWQGRPLLKGKA